MLVCVALAALGIIYFAGFGTKPTTLLAGLGIIALLATGDLKRLKNAPALLLIGYVLFSWLTIFWAMSGKFHLREWSKILIALFFFLLLVLRGKNERTFLRKVMGGIVGISAFYAFASVEAAETGVCKALLQKIPNMVGQTMAFDGSRLFGIFGNSNIEASIYAIGILFSLSLLCGSENKREKILFAVTLSFNAFAFLLAFSMGAIACFAVAIVMYLISAGKQRGAALLRMLEAAVPTVLFAFFATRLFERSSSAVLMLMLCNAAVTAALELFAADLLSAALERHGKLTFALIAAVLALGAVYAVIGTQITGAYTFGGELPRSVALTEGEHTLCVEADSDVQVAIYSKTQLEIMSISNTPVYSGPCAEATFTVPAGSEMCDFVFSAPEGSVIRTAILDGQTALPLAYRLLPDFIGNRIQNLSNSTSVVQRKIFCADGMKIFRLSPVIGNGVGAYETGLTAVQDFPYETKYVHNHYVQILLEDGVIGFALYAAALLAMAFALWKKRASVEDSPLFGVYPALCAEFVMNGTQMLWDVSMSMILFVCMTYAVYALIVLTCAEPLGKQPEPVAEAAPKRKKTATNKGAPSLPRIAAITVTGIIVLTLCGNLYAGHVANPDAPTLAGFLNSLDRAAKTDLYESNDAKLSYVMATAADEADSYRSAADSYAKELAQVQSNTIPLYLIEYYLQTGQYEAAIDEAMLGATYSSTDSQTWNASASLLKQAFFDNAESSPLLTDRETLMPKLADYRSTLLAHNASAYLPVELDEQAQQFFDKVGTLDGCADNQNAFTSTLLTQ